jgi:uncharacterized membrane protein
MATFHVFAGSDEQLHFPAVRKIGLSDLIVSLQEGWQDFWAKPSHLVFLGVIYPLMGVVIGIWTSGANAWPLIFPLISGFALIGPLAALPIYEMSRHREMGLETTWRSAFGVLRSPAIPSIAAIGILLLGIFTVWLMVAQFIYESLFGPGSPSTFVEFVNEVFNTPQGLMLMIWGNLVGLLFAIVVLATSVISIPLLLDRDGGAAGAVLTSVRAVLKNPVPMAAWGLIVAALLVIGSLPLLVGLAVVVPVLGHATWHLYRKVVPPAD